MLSVLNFRALKIRRDGLEWSLSHILSCVHLYSRVLDTSAGCSDVDLNTGFAVVAGSKIDSVRVRPIEANAPSLIRSFFIFQDMHGLHWLRTMPTPWEHWSWHTPYVGSTRSTSWHAWSLPELRRP